MAKKKEEASPQTEGAWVKVYLGGMIPLPHPPGAFIRDTELQFSDNLKGLDLKTVLQTLISAVAKYAFSPPEKVVVVIEGTLEECLDKAEVDKNESLNKFLLVIYDSVGEEEHFSLQIVPMERKPFGFEQRDREC